MSTAQQLGLIGNSIKVQSLPTASAETFGAGNRFYTLIGQQEGYITGHTYHTIVANDVYSWEDIAQADGGVQTYACANAAELQAAILSKILPASQQGKKIYLRILSGVYNGACFPLSVIDETRYSRVYISGTWSSVGWSGSSTASGAGVTRHTFVAISLSDYLPVVFTDGVSLEGAYRTPNRTNCDAQTEIIIS